MTVGAALQDLTGLRLFHNHLAIEAVLPVFDFGSPPFSRLVDGFRVRVFEEVVASELPGLIFTYVWAFDHDSDRALVERMKAIFESRGGRTVFVELWADLQTRLERNASEFRLLHKPSKRNVEESAKRLVANEAKYRMSSNGDFPFAEYLRIDNTHVEPGAAADRIVDRFSLPRRMG